MDQMSKCNLPAPEQDLCYWINSLARAALRCMAGRLVPYDMTMSQLGILMMCSKGGVNTVSGLARMMPIDAAAVSRNVHTLTQRGLLRKEPSLRDRRSATLSVTESGTVLLEELAVLVEANNRMLLKGISTADKDRFVSTVKTMLANTAAYETTRLGEPYETRLTDG
ncbi:MarR family winged helix-turn-helix transcriptional regulator [Candidatus Spongiisocius sp.]|uniref:MarR family winged helix-turn-helix transcriptional regulator n=1 Tax=Candidatus Spongiisocius sp. TaxID=3101273 RepID=UPI003B599617